MRKQYRREVACPQCGLRRQVMTREALCKDCDNDRRRATSDRLFWTKTVIDERGCWLWTGARQTPSRATAEGYGMVSRFRRVVYAHRHAYELTRGPIPEGMFVLHSCDRPPCVNPAHLRVGTLQDNSRDMARRNRVGRSALTHDQVREMRALFAAGVSRTTLRTKYGVSDQVVNNCVSNRHYKDVA